MKNDEQLQLIQSELYRCVKTNRDLNDGEGVAVLVHYYRAVTEISNNELLGDDAQAMVMGQASLALQKKHDGLAEAVTAFKGLLDISAVPYVMLLDELYECLCRDKGNCQSAEEALMLLVRTDEALARILCSNDRKSMEAGLGVLLSKVDQINRSLTDLLGAPDLG